ncbi:MAG: hypothetical protein AMR96_05535 [Candidatus Adiutrix intracellularis]|jgi:DNA-binding Lrp family transcriptional regulator|nr:MAG: hypothetical protein AMR96_05535 [Candidatus Adiutrix intracellularis]MDR2827513.1 Lrp/AsnC family transcriptional regulator [Candidatus Adiutrix intracellularis]
MTNCDLDNLDRLILNVIQNAFPVAAHPYAVLATRLNEEHNLNLTEYEMLQRVTALRQNGFIRRLGAVFNPRTLGYYSTLCAAKVPPDKLEKITEFVNAAPQVTHNYLRSDELNLWFTFTTRHPKELKTFLTRLKETKDLAEIHTLATEKLFKIKVDFYFPPH